MAAASRRIRPWHSLALCAVIIGLLYSLVFFTGQGDPTPTLGVDLQGGSRVTLTPLTADDWQPAPGTIEQARRGIEDRANAFGVGGAEVLRDGTNVIITVPGDDAAVARTLAQATVLHFRPVISQQVAGVPDEAAEQFGEAVGAERVRQARALLQSRDQQVQQVALTSLNCAANPLGGNDDPNLPLVTCDRSGTQTYLLGPAFLSVDRIQDVSVDPRADGSHQLVLDLDRTGEGIWSRYTMQHVGQQVAVVLDGTVLAAPPIQRPIPLGQPIRIAGQFGQAEADELATLLRSGPLPLSFTVSEAETVSATLGADVLRAVLIAGALGVAAVFVSCLAYYRLLGLLPILSLTLSALILYAVLVLAGRWIGVALDLAGVAGLLVAVILVADSFVILVERLKDEMRDGRTFSSAVPHGWVRARRTVMTAAAAVFVGAVVLYLIAVGPVRNFAFVLGASTVLAVLVSVLVTHPLVTAIANSRLGARPELLGLGSVHRADSDDSSAQLATAGKGAAT